MPSKSYRPRRPQTDKDGSAPDTLKGAGGGSNGRARRDSATRRTGDGAVNKASRNYSRESTSAADIRKHSRDAHLEASKKKTTLKRVLLVAAGVLVVATTAVVIYAVHFMGTIGGNIALKEEELAALNDVLIKPATPEEPYYVLLLGSDSRDPWDSNAGRSDSIILARIDPAIPSMSLLSVPRDTKIELEGYGIQKINAAFAYYGPAGVVKAVSQLCGVDIAHYAQIDFSGLISLVDQLGGATVKVPVDLSYQGAYLYAGEQHLNGEQALLMCRSRGFPDGDFQRVKNQRILLHHSMEEYAAGRQTFFQSVAEHLVRVYYDHPLKHGF